MTVTSNLNRLVDRLVEQIVHAHEAAQSGRPVERCMVALVGVPASGKTTAAQIIADLVRNRLYERLMQAEQEDASRESTKLDLRQSLKDLIVVTPMDGYHLTRERLQSDHAKWLSSLELGDAKEGSEDSAMQGGKENSKHDLTDPFSRRGAYWTFDALELSKALKEVKQGYGKEIKMHGWSHALKDPSYNAISISSRALMVIVEGLYLLLEGDESVEEWSVNVAPVFSTRILLECDLQIAADRGSLRNWKAGITDSLESSRARWFKNDHLNGK